MKSSSVRPLVYTTVPITTRITSCMVTLVQARNRITAVCRLMYTAVMAKSSCTTEEEYDVHHETQAAVPFSAVPLSVQPLCTAVPYSAVDITALHQCSLSETSSGDDPCPLSEIDVEELVGDVTKRKRRNSAADKRGKDKKRKKDQRTIPNAFVALPIRSVSVRHKVEQLQHHLIQKEPKMTNVLIPINRLHVTLMVIKLENEDDISRAKLALKEIGHQSRQVEPLALTFSGLSSFGSRVLYVDFDERTQTSLKLIADKVRSTFECHGLPSTDKRPFSAHLTVAKVSRDRGKSVRKINEELYLDWTEEFGQDQVKELELLSMTKRDESGYYFCYARENFVNT